MDVFTSLSPGLQLLVVFAGGLIATPLLILISAQFPATPITLDDMERGVSARELEKRAQAEREAARPSEPSPGSTLRRRGGASTESEPPAAATVIDGDDTLREEATERLEAAIISRAENMTGGATDKGPDPFNLSDFEYQRLEKLTKMLMPSLTQREVDKEVADAIERARADWQVRGDVALKEAAAAGMNPRSIGRCLDFVFVLAIVCVIMYILHSEYGWQPMDAMRTFLPREAAVLEGRAYSGEGGLTSQFLMWLGLRTPALQAAE
jgi:hypothetical protein